MSNSIFYKKLLQHYQVLDRPGTFIVTVASDVTEDSLYLKDEYPRYLIPLRVICSEDLPILIKLIKEETVPFFKIKKFFLTGAIFDNNEIDIINLPAKGEQVVATFETKDDVLLCTHIKLIDRDNLLYINLSAIDDLYQLAEQYLSKNYE